MERPRKARKRFAKGRFRRLPKPGAKPGPNQADRDRDMLVKLVDDGRLSGRVQTFEVVVWYIVV